MRRIPEPATSSHLSHVYHKEPMHLQWSISTRKNRQSWPLPLSYMVYISMKKKRARIEKKKKGGGGGDTKTAKQGVTKTDRERIFSRLWDMAERYYSPPAPAASRQERGTSACFMASQHDITRWKSMTIELRMCDLKRRDPGLNIRA